MNKLLLVVWVAGTVPVACSSAAVVDCSDESAFVVIGGFGEGRVGETAKALERAIAAREGKPCRSVSALNLPKDETAARQALVEYASTVRKDEGVKRVGALVTPSVYVIVTNVFAYDFRLPKEARASPLGSNRHADVLKFEAGGNLAEDVMDFVCGYRIDCDNPVCSFESGEPSLTAAEAIAAMEAGEWIDEEVARTRKRLTAWQGKDEVVLVAFECDLHVYSPTRGMWKNRAALLAEGNFRHVKRFARVANALGADLAADLGDVGYDYSDRHWKHACKSERVARMALQRTGYDLLQMPFMALQGNHDGHWDSLSDFGTFFNPPTAKRARGFEFGPTRGYGYYDLPAKQTRIFFLNTCESGTGGWYEIRSEQVDWVRKAVDETPDGWTVAFFSHDCLHRTAGNEDWKERPVVKASKGYCDMRTLFETIAAGRRLKLAGAYCGDSHFNRLHVENGVRYFVCDAAFYGKGEKRVLVHVAAIKPRTGDAKLFRVGVGGVKGDL